MSQRLLNLIDETDRLVFRLTERRERALKELVRVDAKLDEAKKIAQRYRKRLTRKEAISSDAADMIKDWNGVKIVTRRTPEVDISSALPDDPLANIYAAADSMSDRAS